VRESKRRLGKRNFASGHSRAALGAMSDRMVEARRLREGLESGSPAPVGASSLHGHSAAIRRVQELVRQLAPASQPVLISGETGTGKDLVARAIHGESQRRERPFVSLACGALPEELLEAELFGYRRGAFTGAEGDHEGLLVSARGGSVLFDEVGDMSLGFQAKLLRVLDRNLVRALGDTTEVEIDVRFLFSTHRDLRALAREGSFRRDLLFRLGAFEVPLPPLRERIEDIPILAERLAMEALGPGSRAGFSDGALRALASHVWHGNVRELRNTVFRLVLGREGAVSQEDVEKALGHDRPRGLFPPELLRQRRIEDLVTQLEREHLVQLHADHGGNLEAMARVLGITVRALYGRFGRLGLRPGDLPRAQP
jgi:DNA-binding NtrC family response regulator